MKIQIQLDKSFLKAPEGKGAWDLFINTEWIKRTPAPFDWLNIVQTWERVTEAVMKS